MLPYSPWYGLDYEDRLPTNRFFYIHSSLWTEEKWILLSVQQISKL